MGGVTSDLADAGHVVSPPTGTSVHWMENRAAAPAARETSAGAALAAGFGNCTPPRTTVVGIGVPDELSSCMPGNPRMVHVADEVLVMPTVVVTVPAAPVPPTTVMWSWEGWQSVVGLVVLVVVVVGATLVVVDDGALRCVVEVEGVRPVDVRDADGLPEEHPASKAASATAPTASGHDRRVPGGRPPGCRALTRRSPPA